MRINEVSLDELDYVAAVCLDPSIPPKWREAMQPCMLARREWLKKMMGKGLLVSVALENPRKAISSLGTKNTKFKDMAVKGKFPEGLIEYLPIEYAPEPVRGRKSLFINCLWVVPPFWRRGVATALVKRAIEKGKARGGVTVLAYEGDKWFGFFQYMPAGFFRKFGFKEVDREGSRVLLHLDLGAAEQPSLILPKTRKLKNRGLVVEVFFNSQCPWSGWMVDRIKRNMKKYDATINKINTDDRKAIEERGMSRGVSINGVPMIRRMASWKEIEALVKSYEQTGNKDGHNR
jgi:ribosomal protein S18 acetylase RimI-like enzyme